MLTALTQSHAGCALLFLHAPASWRKLRRSVLALGVEMITDEVSGESSKALMEACLQYVTYLREDPKFKELISSLCEKRN